MVSALLAAHHVTHESPPPLSHRTPYLSTPLSPTHALLPGVHLEPYAP